jgi:methyltransferase (TIGR00027 family)
MRANQASATAYLIAESTLLTAGTPRLARFIPARAAELSARFIDLNSRGARIRQSFRDSRWGRRGLNFLEKMSIPGLRLHYALRKRFLEETARTALADGFTQMVVFGAGFDTLALRLGREFPLVHFIEVDHPATQRVKTAALDRAADRPANLRFLSLELTGPTWETDLAAGGFRSGVRTLFMAEGLLMYFTPDQVTELFRFVRAEGGAGSRFAFTYMERRPDGRIAFRGLSRVVDLWLRIYGEPFKWGVAPGGLARFLSAEGFQVRDRATPAVFRERYLEPHGLAALPLAHGEYVCVADPV